MWKRILELEKEMEKLKMTWREGCKIVWCSGNKDEEKAMASSSGKIRRI